MPSQDEIMQQIVKLVSEGAGMPLSPEIEDALRERYYKWIADRKTGVPTSPQEIWDAKEGKAIQRQIMKIGEDLAKKKKEHKTLDKAESRESCIAVERLSECPHCMDPQGG